MRFAPQIPVGIVSDDTAHTAPGRWSDASNMRPSNGFMETVKGWESVISTLLGGVCRAAFPWSGAGSVLDIAFGTHATLEVYEGGELSDITPTLAMPSFKLSANFLTVTDASAVVTAAHQGHGLTTGGSVIITGATSVGRIVPNGTFTVTVSDPDSFDYTFSSPADLAETLGNNPFAVVISTPTVTVTDTAHGIPDGTVVTFSGASAVGGITPAGAFPITVIDANSYRFTFTSNATSTASGGGNAVVATVPSSGGGSAIVVAPQVAFAVGSIDGSGSAGYGTGGYGVGGYGEPSTAEYFPRTWSLAAWGQTLMASPRGGTIYNWTNNTATPAAPLAHAPRQVTTMLVASQDQVFALGCNEEVSGVFNPRCIRHSGVRASTVWNTASDTTAREYVLPGGGAIVGARVMGVNILVWTTSSLFLGQFVGSLEQPWSFNKVGDHCGLAGVNAAVVVGQQAFWISPDRQFYSYSLGGAPQPIPCSLRTDFSDNLAASQADKIIATSVGERGEVWWYYPDDRDGTENSRYIALSMAGTDIGAWFRGIMARTAAADAGPSQYPCRTTADGHIYWHERGESADGAALSYFIESTDLQMSEGQSMLVNAMWPDFQGQRGAINLTLKTRFRPQGVQTIKGPYSIEDGAEKVDLRALGTYIQIRYEGSSSPASCRIGLPVFDLQAAGKR